MSDVINLVQGDNRPYIKLTFTKSDGTPLDLSDASTTIAVKLRSVKSSTLVATLTAAKVDGGSTGIATFNFPGSTLSVEPGSYEGEVEISFGAEKHTVYDRLKFFVRSQFS
jgi:hypothetical protein